MRNFLVGTISLVSLCCSSISGQTADFQSCSAKKNLAKPVDGISRPYDNKPFLLNEHVEERDVMFEKKIWRELELSEKMNHHFSNVKGTFLDVLKDAFDKNQIELYDAADDNFSCPLTAERVKNIFGRYDTISVFNPDKEIYEDRAVYSTLNQNNLVRYRIKEVWYFDSKHSKMKVRILGIAPVMRFYSENGALLAESPLFWIYYPHARETLAQISIGDNVPQAKNLSWDDIFQFRYFSSHITKENNLYDRRISDYKSGYNALTEADNIHNSIFNYEQDLWER